MKTSKNLNLARPNIGVKLNRRSLASSLTGLITDKQAREIREYLKSI